MAAEAKAASRRAAAAKKQQPLPNTKSIPIVQHDPTRPPPLNLKDQSIFKQILHLYEIKQYSTALQHCETLLAKYPGHGETTAMAGLLHHSLNNKSQGYSMVKAGMKADLKSHIVWHVYGIITRADRNYLEAVKCYGHALRLDPENHNILRDLAVLQIQVRQYPAYVESRWKLLRSNRRPRTAWLSLSMAYALNQQPDAALEILNALEGFEIIHEPEQSFERSETILFKASLLPPSEALPYLESSSGLILDRPRYLLTRAQHLTQLGRQEAAEWAWLDLLDTNDENRTYLEGYLSNRSQVTTEDSVDTLKRLAERYPTSQLIKRSILDHATGARFDQELESYLCSRFTKGIPSLFNDLKPLLVDPVKLNSVKTLTEKLYDRISKYGCFESTKNLDGQQPASTLVWILHFLCQLYGSSCVNMAEEAIKVSHEAIQHTPSLPDCYLSLARVYKRSGSFEKAAQALRSARELDGQDRFLNSKCAKYVLRSIGSTTGQTRQAQIQLLEESRQLVGLFTRKDAPDPVSDLVDMQAVWYVMAEAEVALRVSDWGLGLKRLHQVCEIFRQWEEDQYDFHTYCIRKNTFNTYQDLLKFEDKLYIDPIYFRAVSKAVEVYLKLHDRKSDQTSSPNPITEYNILVKPHHDRSTAQDLNGDQNSTSPNGAGDNSSKQGTEEESSATAMSKKALKKAKMAEIKAKAQAALEAKKASSKAKSGEPVNTETADVVVPPPDEDPAGEKLLKVENPLEAAIELLKPIECNMIGLPIPTDPSKRIVWLGVLLCRFEIELRRGKPLLALKALLKAHKLTQRQNSIEPSVFVALTKLKSKYLQNAIHDDPSDGDQPTTIRKVITRALDQFERSELSEDYRCRLARAEGWLVQRNELQKSSSTPTDSEGTTISNERIEEEIFSLFTSDHRSESALARLGINTIDGWKVVLKGLRLLENFHSSRSQEFRLKAHRLWDLVDEFKVSEHDSNSSNGMTPHPGHPNLDSITDEPLPTSTPNHPNGASVTETSHRDFDGSIEVRDF